MIAPTVAFFALGALAVRAQQATELELQYAQAQFMQSRIVPDMLSEFNPSAVLSVQFNTSDSPTPIGSALTIADVVAMPDITVMPGANFSSEGAFTVAMVDPGVAGADQSAGQTRHWLVNNVYLVDGDDGMSLNYTTEAITSYGGPYPAEGSGAHRYTILLLPQPESFQAPAELATPGIAISLQNFPDYIQTTGLQPPVAGWYMQVEQGTSTASAAETSAVQSSTLPAFGASSSAASMASSGAAGASSASASAGASMVSSRAAGSGSSLASVASSVAGAAASSAVPGSNAFAQYAPSGALAAVAAGVFALL